MELEVGSFMRRYLEDDKGETKFKHGLESDKAPKCVIVTLFCRCQQTDDQQYCHHAAEALEQAAKDRECDSLIQPDGMEQPLQPAPFRNPPRSIWRLNGQ